MTKENNQPIAKYDSIFSLLVRVFWMLLGNAILAISAIFITQGKDWKFQTADVVFWVIVAALLLARYLDIKFYSDSDSTGQPASMVNWRKYAAILLIISTAVWVLAHVVNYLMVKPA
jgi:hypothetical protein